MTDYFQHAWAETHAIERGYANNPDDPGGETMHGITARVARAWGYTGSMRDLPASLATKIARAEYWDALRLDEVAQLSPAIALELFDTNFNLWAGAAAQWFQRALNVLNLHPDLEVRVGGSPDLKVDGVIGSATIARLGMILRSRAPGEAETVLLCTLNALQCADYLRQATGQIGKRAFYAGWVLKRVRMDGGVGRRV